MIPPDAGRDGGRPAAVVRVGQSSKPKLRRVGSHARMLRSVDTISLILTVAFGAVASVCSGLILYQAVSFQGTSLRDARLLGFLVILVPTVNVEAALVRMKKLEDQLETLYQEREDATLTTTPLTDGRHRKKSS